MKRKSTPSVRQAVEQVYNHMPDTFHAPFFCIQVKEKCNRPILMDGTILRRLREARADSLDFNYRCIDPELALYQKIKVV